MSNSCGDNELYVIHRSSAAYGTVKMTVAVGRIAAADVVRKTCIENNSYSAEHKKWLAEFVESGLKPEHVINIGASTIYPACNV